MSSIASITEAGGCGPVFGLYTVPSSSIYGPKAMQRSVGRTDGRAKGVRVTVGEDSEVALAVGIFERVTVAVGLLVGVDVSESEQVIVFSSRGGCDARRR